MNMITRMEDGVPPSKAAYDRIELFETANVPIFSNVEVDIAPSAGKLWKISDMLLFVEHLPLGASGGEHALTLYSHTTPLLYGASVYGSDLIWRYSMWDIANYSKKPTSDEAALIALGNIYMTKENPLTVRYNNNTDAIQTNPRQIRLSVIETPLI